MCVQFINSNSTAWSLLLQKEIGRFGFSFHKQATHDWGGKSSYFLKDCNNDLLNAVQAHKDEEIKIDKIVNPLIMKIRGKRSL